MGPVQRLCLIPLAIMALVACSTDDRVAVCDACVRSEALVEAAKLDLSTGNFSKAKEKCTKAADLYDKNTQARYCLVLAEYGLMTSGINTVLATAGSTLSSTFGTSGYKKTIDGKQVLLGYTAQLEPHMRAIDLQIAELSDEEDVRFQVNRVPVRYELRKLATFLNDRILSDTESSYRVPSEIELDLGGTWDLSEMLILGASFNLGFAALDYVFAHDLNVRELPNEYAITDYIAAFLIQNPTFLSFESDLESEERLHGGDVYKGMGADMVAFFSYLAGRDESIGGAVGASVGLQEAIRLSAAEPATDAVVKWIDEDGDGHPEALEAKFLNQLLEQLIDDSLPRIPVPFAPETFEALYAFSSDSLDNLEAGAAPVPVRNLLENLRLDIGGLLTSSAFGFKAVPDLVSLDWRAFLESPVPVRELAPYYYSYQQYDETVYDLVYEWEVFDYNEVRTHHFDFHNLSWRYRYDEAHFVNIDAGLFPSHISVPDLALADDGASPNPSLSSLPYIALQSPSFGGLLHLNPEAVGGEGGYGKATHGTFNATAGRFLKYYCVDFNYSQYYYTGYSLELKSACPNGSESL